MLSGFPAMTEQTTSQRHGVWTFSVSQEFIHIVIDLKSPQYCGKMTRLGDLGLEHGWPAR